MGLPGIPELEDHRKVFDLLPAESELGMSLTSAYQLVPGAVHRGDHRPPSAGQVLQRRREPGGAVDEVRAKMHFGIEVVPLGDYADPRNVLELAIAAEKSGWEGLFVWDHLGYVWGAPAADPWVTLSAVAAHTRRLKLCAALRLCHAAALRYWLKRWPRSTCSARDG